MAQVFRDLRNGGLLNQADMIAWDLDDIDALSCISTPTEITPPMKRSLGKTAFVAL
jgi:hypothetical protein